MSRVPMYAIDPETWVIVLECPHLVDGAGKQFVECGGELEVFLTGSATYTVPTHCANCDRDITKETQAVLRERAQYEWDNYEPTEAELTAHYATDGGEDDRYRAVLRDAGRGHLL